MKKDNKYKAETTYDLAFGLAAGTFNEKEKFAVLTEIREREKAAKEKVTIIPATPKVTKVHHYKKGSKSEKINELLKKGKTPREILDMMNAKKQTVYYAEIYRIKRNRDQQ